MRKVVLVALLLAGFSGCLSNETPDDSGQESSRTLSPEQLCAESTISCKFQLDSQAEVLDAVVSGVYTGSDLHVQADLRSLVFQNFTFAPDGARLSIESSNPFGELVFLDSQLSRVESGIRIHGFATLSVQSSSITGTPICADCGQDHVQVKVLEVANSRLETWAGIVASESLKIQDTMLNNLGLVRTPWAEFVAVDATGGRLEFDVSGPGVSQLTVSDSTIIDSHFLLPEFVTLERSIFSNSVIGSASPTLKSWDILESTFKNSEIGNPGQPLAGPALTVRDSHFEGFDGTAIDFEGDWLEISGTRFLQMGEPIPPSQLASPLGQVSPVLRIRSAETLAMVVDSEFLDSGRVAIMSGGPVEASGNYWGSPLGPSIVVAGVPVGAAGGAWIDADQVSYLPFLIAPSSASKEAKVDSAIDGL